MTMGVIAAVAQFEKDLLIERTLAGQARAKAEGKKFGRPAVLTDEGRAKALLQPRTQGRSAAWIFSCAVESQPG
jgi:putative DNA-invertase from lambdoid prophage Rac